jgi:hypothetical protein
MSKCSACQTLGHKSNSKKFHPKPKIQEIDDYTPNILRQRYSSLRDLVESFSLLPPHIRKLVRGMNIPEDISENIVKFIIRNTLGDDSCSWCKSVGMTGDLYSIKEGIQEVKAFSSDGPSSFGPRKKFDVIYFLDMRQWLRDTIILWKVNLNNESSQWKELKMNKKEDHKAQADRGIRPHIAWDKIYPQISDHCTKVYEGTFEGIFMPVAVAPVAEQSVVLPAQTLHFPPVCTDVNLLAVGSDMILEIPEN